jgi:hypothetical protein
MAGNSPNDVDTAWDDLESAYRSVRKAVDAFSAEAGLIGAQLIQDVPTRMEYMRMIRAEADDVLAFARKNRASAAKAFEFINARRDELRLIQQDKARAAVAVLSKLLTKHPAKHQLLVNAANALAREGKLPSVKLGTEVKAVPLEKLSPDQLDDVFLKAIDKAGGSRKTITPTNMKLRGAGLLLLTVALAGVDICLAQDKSFAVTKNVSSIAVGAGGAWAFAAAGLAIGGPVGGLVGLIVGGIVGSYVGEEAHYAVRGLHSHPKVDTLVSRYYGALSFDEEALGRALHVEFLGDLELVVIAFSHLNEKRNADADDVATAYVEAAMRVHGRNRDGALADGLRTPMGQALVKLLHDMLDEGWTTHQERMQMTWLQSVKG